MYHVFSNVIQVRSQLSQYCGTYRYGTVLWYRRYRRYLRYLGTVGIPQYKLVVHLLYNNCQAAHPRPRACKEKLRMRMRPA